MKYRVVVSYEVRREIEVEAEDYYKALDVAVAENPRLTGTLEDWSFNVQAHSVELWDPIMKRFRVPGAPIV